MKESLRELYDREIASYEADFLEPEEKENIEKLMRKQHDKIFYTLDFDDKVTLIKLENCHKQLAAQKQKDAFINGFALAMTYMLKNDR